MCNCVLKTVNVNANVEKYGPLDTLAIIWVNYELGNITLYEFLKVCDSVLSPIADDIAGIETE